MLTILIFMPMLLKVGLFSWARACFFFSVQLRRLAAVLFSLVITCLISSSSISIELKDYSIGPQDVLKIEVWDNPDLSREVTVSLKNTISFPLIGEMQVEGYTVENLQQKIRTRLADGYLVNPQVTVTVKEYNSKKVYVLGEVEKPGYYPFSKVTTMVEIISMAGGLTPDAGQEAYIIRSPEKIDPDDIKHLIQGGKNDLPSETAINSSNTIPGKGSASEGAVKNQVITLNLNDFNQGINLNFELQNNDTLYIPKAQFFYVIGEVKSPGRFKLEKEVNVLQTISMAGGLTQKASERKIRIIRTLDGKEHEIKAKMTDLVLPDDIIKVPESFF
ncbi:MAG: polysaccharide biosynthesis/export family protein [bacterium]